MTKRTDAAIVEDLLNTLMPGRAERLEMERQRARNEDAARKYARDGVNEDDYKTLSDILTQINNAFSIPGVTTELTFGLVHPDGSVSEVSPAEFFKDNPDLDPVHRAGKCAAERPDLMDVLEKNARVEREAEAEVDRLNGKGDTVTTYERWIPPELHPNEADDLDYINPPIRVRRGYYELFLILKDALEQAQHGKGKERHQRGDVPFIDQPILQLTRAYGHGFSAGQAAKKLGEASRMVADGKKDQAIFEMLGAINYIAATVLYLSEKK